MLFRLTVVVWLSVIETIPPALTCSAPIAYAQDASPETTTEAMLPAEAQQALRSLIPSGKKFVMIDAYVAGTHVKDVNLGVSCSSNASGSINGSVDDNGNIQGTTNSNGSSDCRERHNYYDTLMLGLPDPYDPQNAVYFVTTQCVVRWIWDHCDMPAPHSTYPIVLEANKKGTFDVYAATEQRLGGKAKAARFAVLSVERIRKKTAVPPSPER
jgi:hypothetical protein